MPSYTQDDAADYENEMPEFQNEGEFDDYLNDEEYDLMNEMFPRAKKALENYQGWNNLGVKLAIFDSEFDLDAALEELMKTLKKKKTASQAPHAPQITNDKRGMYREVQSTFFFHNTAVS